MSADLARRAAQHGQGLAADGRVGPQRRGA